MAPSQILVTSLSRVIPIHYEWCLDMPSLTDVNLSSKYAFKYKTDVTKNSTYFIPFSRIDIGALQNKFNWPPRGTWFLSVPHTYFPFTTKLIQRYWRECYRCANMEIMMTSMWNDGNSIRMVETRSDDHSLQIAWNPHRITLQNTHIASPFKGESKQNHSTTINKEQRNTHRKTLSHRLQSSHHDLTPLHSTILSQQMKPLNTTFFSSPKPQSEPKSPLPSNQLPLNTPLLNALLKTNTHLHYLKELKE